jgi:hypothetical protein
MALPGASPRISYPSLEPKKRKGEDSSDLPIPKFGISSNNNPHDRFRNSYKDLAPDVPQSQFQSHQGRWRIKNQYQNDKFDEFRETHDIKFLDPELGQEGEIWQETDAIDELTLRSPREKESTITNSEREAFQKIFADIFTRYQGPSPATAAPRDFFEEHGDLEAETFKPERPKKDKAQKTRAKLGDIMKDVVNKSATREQLEEIVSRYPAPLRAAASRAVGLDKAIDRPPTEEGAMAAEAVVDTRLVELQNAEQLRVETLMRNAETDFALWAILEKEVFPLIDKLGLGELKGGPRKENIQAEDATTKQTSNKAKKSKKAQLLKEPPAESKTIIFNKSEDGISSLELYGPLYPSHLLLALRLLDRSFTKPSPLTFSILPKIKSLGLISQVLGASTQLYNELITIYWHRRDDFRGVLDLLQEMEQSGLDWDQNTLDLVEDIRRLQRAAVRGDRGDTVKALFRFPEFAPGGFDAWATKIKRGLADRDGYGVGAVL